jgi:hypothetical protein
VKDIKLIVMVDDESWFWVWDSAQLMWIAFYEVDDKPAVHAAFSDRHRIEDVLDMMKHIAQGASIFVTD